MIILSIESRHDHYMHHCQDEERNRINKKKKLPIVHQAS
jgi:hypothetical protein